MTKQVLSCMAILSACGLLCAGQNGNHARPEMLAIRKVYITGPDGKLKAGTP